jgi:hypothetical protein
MINYAGSIETVTSKEFEQENSHLFEKAYPFSSRNVSVKKARRRSRFKNRIPLCNWTMPAQPEGYIRAGKYDLL